NLAVRPQGAGIAGAARIVHDGEVLRIEPIKVDEGAGGVVVGTIDPAGEVETHAILLEWTAEPWIDVVIDLDGVRGWQPARLQIVREVVALHAVVRECDERRAAESVAAIARDVVDSDAALRLLGGHSR